MELFAAGFNAWRQLEFESKSPSNEPNDIFAFQSILKDDIIERPSAFLSCTFVKTASGIRQAGFVEDFEALARLKDKLISSTAAIAGNGIIAEYDGMNTIFQYSSRSVVQTDRKQDFSGIGPIIQLVAYETGFVALTQDGHVWTWGDERYAACLGRETTDETPAERPGIVEELEDLPTGKVTKISAAGYNIVALTEGHDLYAWGGQPGRRALIEGLSSSPMPVVVEESDILDCGVGESHMIVLTQEGDVYVIGDNTNGPLGLPVNEATSWTKVPVVLQEGQSVVGVQAGQRTSFILTQCQAS
ncbi:RCC1/BLIP-II [Xylariaceae sp. FL0662B]|nr:RCC1/BLIP-II [Xylariaceae sp. FL0662B]